MKLRYRLHYKRLCKDANDYGSSIHKFHMDFKTKNEAIQYLNLLNEDEDGWIEDLVTGKKL